MNDKKWLDGYSGQSTQELIAFEKTYRTDSIILAFEQAIGQKAARQGESSLTADERSVLAIEALEREVNNGGYSQFFVNSSSEYTPLVVESLNRINCPIAAEITQEAIAALHAPELSQSQIESTMERKDDHRDAALESCDKRFFKESENIADRLLNYIKSHQNNFRL